MTGKRCQPLRGMALSESSRAHPQQLRACSIACGSNLHWRAAAQIPTDKSREEHPLRFLCLFAGLCGKSGEVKAVILAAGKGTRMRDLTESLPKPMLKVQGKPILEHILEGLKSAGIRKAFMVTGYRADVVESYFGSGERLGMQISYGRQLVQDGTGKAPELAQAFVGSDPFLLTYGDILVAPDTYAQMIRRFNDGSFSGVITVTASEDVTKGGL